MESGKREKQRCQAAAKRDVVVDVMAGKWKVN